MNKRLLLSLYDRSGLGAYMPVDLEGYELEVEEHMEKFAELILIEVTDILSTYRCKVVFQDGAEYNYEHPIIAIRKHFGVEE